MAMPGEKRYPKVNRRDSSQNHPKEASRSLRFLINREAAFSRSALKISTAHGYGRGAVRISCHASNANPPVGNADSCVGFRDPILDYGIVVTRSLIRTGLGEY